MKNPTSYKVWGVIVLCVLCRLALAQRPAYLTYGTRDGLSSSRNYHMLQDREGYLWLATDQGLVRFDGERFKTYGIADGLADPDVFKLFEDKHGRLWFSSFRRRPSFRWEGAFYPDVSRPLLRNIRNDNISFFGTNLQDSSILLLVNKVAVRLTGTTPEELTAEVYLNRQISCVQPVCTDFLAFNGDTIFRLNSMRDGAVLEPVFCYPKHVNVYGLVVGKDKIINCGEYQTTLLEYTGDTCVILDETTNRYTYIFADREKRFWALSPGRGAFRLPEDPNAFVEEDVHLPGKQVTVGYQDSEGNLWFSVTGEGLYCLPDQPTLSWDKSSQLTTANITALAVGNEQELLLGDDTGSIYRLVNDKLDVQVHLGSKDGENRVRNILQLPDGRLRAATDEGLFALEQLQIAPSGQYHLTVYPGACKDALIIGDMVVYGTNGALVRNHSYGGVNDTLVMGRNTCLAYDWEGYLWKGTTKGLYSDQDDFLRNWSGQFPVLDRRMVKLLAVDEELWILTAQNEVLRAQVKNGEIVRLRTYITPRPYGVSTMLVDADENCWLGANQGVFVMDNIGHWRHFNHQHGLVSNEVNDLVFVRDTLWVATTAGLSKLIPKRWEAVRESQQNTRLVEFRYWHQGQPVVSDFSGRHHEAITLVLPAGSSRFEMDFAALPYRLFDNYTYRHQLQSCLLPFPHYTFGNGWEALWGIADTVQLQQASWDLGFNMPPGRYEISSVAHAANSQVASLPQAWQLTILPKWYQTIWPWLVLMFVLTYLLSKLVRTQLDNLRLSTTTVQAHLSALRTQINPHFIGNSINAIQQFFYPPAPEKAADYIHFFNQLLRRTMDMSEKDFIPLREEIAYSTAYLEMIKLRYGPRFKFSIAIDTVSELLPFPTMFLQPLLENATIHGLALEGGSEVHVNFEQIGARLICTITDNGPGYNDQLPKQLPLHRSKRSSRGIAHLKTKRRLINKLYQIDMQLRWQKRSELIPPAPGTLVEVSFLLKASITQKLDMSYNEEA